MVFKFFHKHREEAEYIHVHTFGTGKISDGRETGIEGPFQLMEVLVFTVRHDW